VVPPPPALLNRDTYAHFKKLKALLAQAKTKNAPQTQASSQVSASNPRRIGWAKHLVAECLREHARPMKPPEIQAWAAERGEDLKKSTVFYVLRQSRLSRSITQLPDGFYELNA
jgi:hypothetical protein